MSINKRIVYVDMEGNTCVIIPSKQWFDEGKTIQQLADKDVPNGFVYKIVDVSQIPQDRYFRNAWKYDLQVDMDKARIIKLGILKSDRDAQLKKLDIEYLIAVGKQDSQKLAAIEVKKQSLRDMPPVALLEMASITTPDELKMYKPEVLR